MLDTDIFASQDGREEILDIHTFERQDGLEKVLDIYICVTKWARRETILEKHAHFG